MWSLLRVRRGRRIKSRTSAGESITVKTSSNIRRLDNHESTSVVDNDFLLSFYFRRQNSLFMLLRPGHSWETSYASLHFTGWVASISQLETPHPYQGDSGFTQYSHWFAPVFRLSPCPYSRVSSFIIPREKNMRVGYTPTAQNT